MFSHLEHTENPAAELEGVIDRLHAWRVMCELRVPEVRLARAGGDDQAVVRDLTPATNRVDSDTAPVEIDIHDLSQHNGCVPLVAEHVADRRRDVPLGENPGRDLIEQRLKQVVVRPVDDGDIDRAAPQRFRRKESAESAADDHDVMPAACC